VRSLAQSALTVSLAAALLGGCGGSPPLSTASGVASPMSPITSARSAVHGLSASYEQLYSLQSSKDGSHPAAGLLDLGGPLYGTTSDGGSSNMGGPFTASVSKACIRCSTDSRAGPYQDYST
jgi:hypothetical protein